MQELYVLAVDALAGACTATVDKQSVRATQTAPESTQVEVVRIPYVKHCTRPARQWPKMS